MTSAGKSLAAFNASRAASAAGAPESSRQASSMSNSQAGLPYTKTFFPTLGRTSCKVLCVGSKSAHESRGNALTE
jgi:hypothetical protein